jgi:RNA exonuclease 1
VAPTIYYISTDSAHVGTAKKGASTVVAGTPPSTPRPATTQPAGGDETSARENKSVEETYQTLNDNLVALHKSLPPATAFILLSGHGDPRKMSEMNTKKAAFEAAIREGRFPAIHV